MACAAVAGEIAMNAGNPEKAPTPRAFNDGRRERGVRDPLSTEPVTATPVRTSPSPLPPKVSYWLANPKRLFFTSQEYNLAQRRCAQWLIGQAVTQTAIVLGTGAGIRSRQTACRRSLTIERPNCRRGNCIHFWRTCSELSERRNYGRGWRYRRFPGACGF